VLSCVGDHNTLLLARFRTTKLLPAAKSPFTGKFFEITTFGIAFYQSNLYMPYLLNPITLNTGHSSRP
jgi:hypothetical protein